MDNIITVENVSFDYVSGDLTNRGVVDVNLEIERGSFLVLIGHNGSGKSTLAKLLNGFFIPDKGLVKVNGIETREEEKTFEIRSKVGMVFQNPDNQMVASIIEDDLAFGPENLGVAPDTIKERIDWALKTVKMEEYKQKTPGRLSGGQKQRIAIAAILVMKPEVLILDESTAMLDPKGRDEVMDTITRLNKEEGMTVVLITHYMEEAIKADKVVVMNEGKIVLYGKPEEVFSNIDVIKKAKLELPVATKVSAILKSNGFKIPLALTEEELVNSLVNI
jgi:energy-coupling factor transport system ATP-binding protein